MQKSNILYLTNKCNLRCDYCYQKFDNSGPEIRPSYEDIKSFIDEIVSREGLDTISTVVLFGGEPLLLKYDFFGVLGIFEDFTIKTGKKFALSTTTNGTIFADIEFLNSFKEKISNLKNTFSLEISYDGKGHNRRVYQNGKSSKEIVENVLEQFSPKEISIRYTIHKDNYKCIFHDLIKLQKYKKIILNYNNTELEEFLDLNDFKSKIKRIAEYLYTIYKTPICYANCELCRGCDFAKFKGINYNSKLSIDGNAGIFNHFTKLQNFK